MPVTKMCPKRGDRSKLKETIPTRKDEMNKERSSKNPNRLKSNEYERDKLSLVESNSETKLRRIQNKLRCGVTRSETLLDMVAKCYSLHAPIEEKPCGDEEIDEKDKDSNHFESERKEFRSISPCLTDPNSVALVNGSPQSLNIGYEGLGDNNDIVDEVEDPLLAGWDDEDLFTFHASHISESYLSKDDSTQSFDGFANLSCSGGDEDKFSSCYDDTDSEVDVVFCGYENGYKKKVETTCDRAPRSTSAPRLSNQRPATPWPAIRGSDELLVRRAGKQKANILKTILLSSLIAILAFFWFPWYE